MERSAIDLRLTRLKLTEDENLEKQSNESIIVCDYRWLSDSIYAQRQLPFDVYMNSN